MKHLFTAFLLVGATASGAAERGYSVTDFDRIRVDGPYKVTLVTGRSPGARAYGAASAIDGVAVELQGRTLIVKRGFGNNWGGFPGQSVGPVEIRVTGQAVRSATVNGAGSLGIDRLRGGSVEMVVAGSGQLEVGAVDTDRLLVAVTGNGRAQVSGKAAIAQLSVRGTGVIDAGGLVVRDLKVAADGPGNIRAAAVSTAGVLSNGSGTIVITGNPACTVKATGSGSVACGRPKMGGLQQR